MCDFGGCVHMICDVLAGWDKPYARKLIVYEDVVESRKAMRDLNQASIHL